MPAAAGLVRRCPSIGHVRDHMARRKTGEHCSNDPHSLWEADGSMRFGSL